MGGSLTEKVKINQYLRTEKEYEDFELRLEFKLLGDAGTNAGVQIYDAKDKADALAKIEAYAEANPDHKVVKLRAWHRVLMNTEDRSVGAQWVD